MGKKSWKRSKKKENRAHFFLNIFAFHFVFLFLN